MIILVPIELYKHFGDIPYPILQKHPSLLDSGYGTVLVLDSCMGWTIWSACMLEETHYPFVEHPRSVVENPQSISQNMTLQTYYAYTQGFDQQND